MTKRRDRNRQARHGQTAAELHKGRCAICMQRITSGQETKPAARGSGKAHLTCPPHPVFDQPSTST